MPNKQNVFSFYLDESIWFQEGQGVRELIGISLEPDITIEDRGDEVCLKGTVDLGGEYMPTGPQTDAESPAAAGARVMDSVEAQGEGIYVFSHAFPVEITVPLERVSNMDDVWIDIETFDYELPADRQLRLHAQLTINGVEEAQRDASNDDTFDEPAQAGPVNFKEEVPEVERAVPEKEAPVFRMNGHQQEEQEQEDDGRWFYKKSQSFPEFFGSQQEPVQDIPVQQPASSDSTSDWGEVSVEESSESSESEAAPGGMDGIKQIFKHLFPNREDTYTRMKMYIAQGEETLTSIAEKYDVPVRQLERVNSCDEDVAPGQIVYIPD
ncbi:LysM peptidoglycan-binding domain-containing protein [Halobacillus litoralis]|uniref:LysM peptidoglycan-binding domain-containing protein n=1 Tax=Halobacillus litoralis TaxID=45668 RepID=A0A845DS00_9BACI|nr:LysM peptidoglycan-binding domain-containing protein [Halobacillus litoralis]MYL19928.1 LysM peptidoglycan-binding domain-containing protein [Halobacillus litoralis]MYL37325.1 LysM peptidoglycan-binding domain-containing protein [Halobacillus litoralis]